MEKKTSATITTLLLLTLVGMVMASDEVAVTADWGACQKADGFTSGEGMEDNASLTFCVNMDNESITVSSVVVTISPGVGAAGTSLTLINSTNTSYYELTISPAPDAGYRYTALATYTNTTNSTGFLDSDDILNLTSLTSSVSARNINVETTEGSNLPLQQQAIQADKKKTSNTDLAIIAVIIIGAIIVILNKEK